MLMLLERLHDPVSKLGNYQNQRDYLGIEPVKLQCLYRSLDYLADNQRYLQRDIFQTNRALFNQTPDVVFYDVTTFYFESEDEQQGALRQKGFGKDGKIGSTQVVFGLLIDKDKNPIGYRLYKGDTFEGHTFTDMVEKLKTEYQIDRMVLVADRGMLSKANRKAVTDKGYEFILGERLKNLPRPVKEKMLDLSQYQLQWASSPENPVVVRYHAFKYEDRTIIATYSQKRADKHKMDRLEKIARAEQLLKHPSRLIKHKITEGQVRKTLSKMQVSHIRQLNEEFYLRSKQGDNENIILISLNINPLPNLILAHKVEGYIK
jgi:transposase